MILLAPLVVSFIRRLGHALLLVTALLLAPALVVLVAPAIAWLVIRRGCWRPCRNRRRCDRREGKGRRCDRRNCRRWRADGNAPRNPRAVGADDPADVHGRPDRRRSRD